MFLQEILRAFLVSPGAMTFSYLSPHSSPRSGLRQQQIFAIAHLQQLSNKSSGDKKQKP